MADSPIRLARSRHRTAWSRLVLGAGVALLGSSPAWAGSAYGIRTQSTSVLASAGAGATAGPYDLSRLSLNPAALGLGTGTEISNALSGIFLTQRAEGANATTALGTSIYGGQGGNAGVSAALGNGYAAFDLDSRTRLGLGFTSYYGLGATWDPGWAGRYYVRSASILTADVMPVLSFRPIPSLILGGGPIVEYVRVKTDTTLDFGTIDQALTGGAFGGVPGRSDGSLNTRADSFAPGVLLGATYEPWQGTRIGVSWRSQIRHQITGDARFSPGGPVGEGLAALTGAFANTRFTSGLNNPSVLTLGISQDVTPALTVFADAQRMGWHSLKSATLNFDNPAQPPAQTVFNMRDSWFVSVGGLYWINERFAIRSGVAFDGAASRDTTRTPSIPDNVAIWAAIGLQVQLSQAMRLDLAYGHVFSGSAPVRMSATQPGNELRGNFSANMRTTSDFVSVQVAWKF